jgi:hypothetical protein
MGQNPEILLITDIPRAPRTRNIRDAQDYRVDLTAGSRCTPLLSHGALWSHGALAASLASRAFGGYGTVVRRPVRLIAGFLSAQYQTSPMACSNAHALPRCHSRQRPDWS